LVPFVHAHSGPEPWAVCAFGAAEHACVTTAAALGGHVRVGFENNLYLKDGSLAADNAALVTQAAQAAHALGRPLATADQIRHRFGG
jgi:3-keto-5-aminohexanoate cleavage enzyme